MDEAGRVAWGRCGAALGAGHPTEGGTGVPAPCRPEGHRSAGPAGAGPAVVSVVEQGGPGPRLQQLRGAL